MFVTVAICTWNRSQLLEQTLSEMRQLRIPQGIDWELLIVNNNCTDDTDQVIARHQNSLPVRRIFEPKQGQCNARNTAIAEARGDLLLWTDDDVLVDPDWLAKYVEVAGSWKDASFFGGTVDPWFDGSYPAWLKANLDRLNGAFAIRQQRSSTWLIKDRSELPFGANMGVRTAVAKAYLYNPAIGLSGKGQIRGDETEVMTRMLADGHRGVWIGSARVRHFIPRERMTRKFVWNWAYGKGQYNVRVGKTAPRHEGRVPRHLWRRYLEFRLLAVIYKGVSHRMWGRSYVRAAIAKGSIDEIRTTTRSSMATPRTAQCRDSTLKSSN